MKTSRDKPKAMPYQRAGVRQVEAWEGRALLADDMGLGKTLQALWYLRRNRATALPAVVTCPAAVKYHWEREALKLGLHARVLEGRTVPKTSGAWAVPDLYIINPQILPHWVGYLQQQGLQGAVMDECQMYQSTGTKSTKAMMRLAKGLDTRLALSGTPLLNRPKELWPTLHMLRPDLWPSFNRFAWDHCDPVKKRWGWTYDGASNLDGLHHQLRSEVMIRRMKSDVLHELPAKVRRVIALPTTSKDLADYREARDNFIHWLRDKRGNAAAKRASRAVAITRLGTLLRLAARVKARGVVDWVGYWLEQNPGQKIVVFANHTKMLDVLQRRIPTPCVRVDGKVTGRHRQQVIDQFIKEPEIRCLVANTKAAGTGVDGLQHVCNTVAFAELSWHPARHFQAEDRVYRIGTTGTAWAYYLVQSGTIEQDMCDLLQTKQTQNSQVLDGGKATGDMNILDQLLDLIAA